LSWPFDWEMTLEHLSFIPFRFQTPSNRDAD
jgi:hypothetical protein